MPTNEEIFRYEMEILEERCFPYQDLYLFESEKDSKIGAGLKAFLKGIQDMLAKAIELMTGKLNKKLKTKQTGEALAALKAQCYNAKAAGKTSIPCYDVVSYQKELDATMKKLESATSSYLKKYNRNGRSVHQTDKMLDEVNELIKKSDAILNKIKSKKIEIPITDLLKWIERELQHGRVRVFDFAEEYLKKLDQYAKMADEYDKKAEAFAKENGVIRRPKGITQSIQNTASYVKRNIDWIGSFSIALVGFGLAPQLKNKAKETEYNHKAATEFRGEGSMLGNSDALAAKTIARTNDDKYETKKGKRLASAEVVTKAAIPAAGMIGTRNFMKAKTERRNSV